MFDVARELLKENIRLSKYWDVKAPRQTLLLYPYHDTVRRLLNALQRLVSARWLS